MFTESEVLCQICERLETVLSVSPRSSADPLSNVYIDRTDIYIPENNLKVTG